MWIPEQMAEIAASGLQARAEALADEQAVRGLDALSEVELHPILAGAFAATGFAVFRERPYPGEASLRPRHAARERCDLVLASSPGLPLLDPVATLKEADAAAGTLFADAALEMLASRKGIDPAEAMWIEIKAVGQFTFTNGVPGPNRSYAGELLTIARSDIPKLSRDPVILRSAVLLVLFTESEEVARHDFAAFMHRCLDKDLSIQSPAIRSFPIPDLIGNRSCSIAVVPVRPAG